MIVEIGTDENVRGTVELSTTGLAYKGDTQEMSRLVESMRQGRDDKALIESLPDRLRSRTWAVDITERPSVSIAIEEKYNTNHDELGRFTFSSVGGGVTIQRHPERYSPSKGRVVATIEVGDSEVEIQASQEFKQVMKRQGKSVDDALDLIEEDLRDVRPGDVANLDKILLRANAEIRDRRLENAPGYYTNTGFVRNVTMTVSEEGRMFGRGMVKHEIGHNAWANLTAEQRVRYAEMVGHTRPGIFHGGAGYNIGGESKALRDFASNEPVRAVTGYGNNNILESWAESYTAIDWGKRTVGSSVSRAARTSLFFGNDTKAKNAMLEEISQW